MDTAELLLALERGRRLKRLSWALQGTTKAQRDDAARALAEVIHSTPPGVKSADYLREVLARVDAGQATYADRIILDGAPVQLLRLMLDVQQLGFRT